MLNHAIVTHSAAFAIIEVMKPTLSIIIPVYNAADKINNIVESVMAQKYDDFELILVNDFSTDNTRAVLADLSRYHSKIKAINLAHNQGASGARNAGLRRAKGTYIMFLDADDNFRRPMIKSMVSAIARGADLVACGFTYNTFKAGQLVSTEQIGLNPLPVQPKDESFPAYVAHLLGVSPLLYQVWNKIYRADIIRQHKLAFQTGLDFGEDLEFNLSYLAHCQKISFIRQALYIYNLEDSGTYQKSSLVFAHRVHNYRALCEFTANFNDANLPDYLAWIRHYWFYSYCLAISRSALPQKTKIQRLKQALSIANLGHLAHRRVIGSKRYLMQVALHWAAASPRRLARLMTFTHQLKSCHLTTWLWQLLRH